MMSFEGFYFFGNVIIALLVIYESIILKKDKGHLYKTPVLTFISIIEFIWMFMSGYMLYKFSVEPLLLIIPSLFVLQSLFGWFYGFHLLKKDGVLEKIEKDMNTPLVIPLKYTDFTLSFGLVFFIISSAGLGYGMIQGL